MCPLTFSVYTTTDWEVGNQVKHAGPTLKTSNLQGRVKIHKESARMLRQPKTIGIAIPVCHAEEEH